MNKQFLSLIAAAVLLSACESSTCGDGMSTCGTDVDGGASSQCAEDFRSNAHDRVYFALDRSDLSEENQKVLEGQAAWLRTYPNVRVSVSGHCDERGTREYNLALGERRANAARNYLVALGVDGTRVDTMSFGKDRPIVPGHTEEAYRENRVAISTVEVGMES
jgi:peptidoglycan-associated lipoprotein